MSVVCIVPLLTTRKSKTIKIDGMYGVWYKLLNDDQIYVYQDRERYRVCTEMIILLPKMKKIK